jgi:hypothetical protein
MGLLKDGHKPQARNTLGDTDEQYWETDNQGKPQDPWKETNYIVLKGVTDSELYTFSTASVGGRGAFKKLCDAYSAGKRMHPGQFPIVALNVGSYDHPDKSRGRIKFPEFKIVDWVPVSVFDDAVAAEEEKAAARQIQDRALEKEADDLLNRAGRGGATTAASGATRF